jgi:hypothetical protein
MVADTFSEEYIFFSNFLTNTFLLGTALKKRWGNHPPAIQKRVNIGSCLCFNSGSASSFAVVITGIFEPVSQSDTTFQHAGTPFRSLPQILSKSNITFLIDFLSHPSTD